LAANRRIRGRRSRGRFRFPAWRPILIIAISRKTTLFAAVLLILAATGAPAPAGAADSPASWEVKNRLQGKRKGDEILKSEDASGIACAPPASGQSGFPRLCLAVDDETQGAQVVILEDGLLVAGDFIALSDDVHDGKPLELDAEGVAYAGGAFYVVGSHGRPRPATDAKKEARAAAQGVATRKLFRIALAPDAVDLATGVLKAKPEIKVSTALAGLLLQDPLLAPACKIALEDNGLAIEGIAVRDGTVYLGLRGPVLDRRDAIVLSVPAAALFDGAPGRLQLTRLPLGLDGQNHPRGIRDLVAYGDGFLLIAGPVKDPSKIAAADFALYQWDGKAAPVKRADFPRLGKKLKPEALLPLEQDGAALRALLLFDGGKEGRPTPFTVTLAP
jgi:hypothetical protein